MKWPLWLCRCLAWLDFGVGLKILAALPPWLATWGVRLRGCIVFALDMEWRAMALGQSYVRRATYQAMRPLHSARFPAWVATFRRYICASWEEYDAQRLATLDFESLKWQESGLTDLLATVKSGQGAVLLTAHFDSLYIGLAILARHGIRVNIMSTKIVEDARVPPDIRAFFAKKIHDLSALLAPGKIIHFEDDLRSFVEALRRGEVLVIAGDGPATSPKRSSAVNFLGDTYRMPNGPSFFARRAAVPICAYACKRERNGSFSISVSKPTLLQDGGLQQAYDRLDESIRAEPWRWWAADLYPVYQKAGSGAAESGVGENAGE